MIVAALIFSVLSFVISLGLAVEVITARRSSQKFILFDPSKQEFENLTPEKKEEITKTPEEFRTIF